MCAHYSLHECLSIAFHKTNSHNCICRHVYDLPCLAFWISPFCGCIFPKDKSALAVWTQSSQKCLYSNDVTVLTLKHYMPTSNGRIILTSKQCITHHICLRTWVSAPASEENLHKLCWQHWVLEFKCLKMLNHWTESVMGDGIQRPADIIAFDIACQINSSVVAQCVSASFVISNILLMNACCHYTALSHFFHTDSESQSCWDIV